MAPVGSRALTGAATAVALAGVAVPLLWRTGVDARASALAAAAALVAIIVGWVIVVHRPTSPVGPALAWSSASIVLVLTNEVLAESAYGPDPLPLSGAARQIWVGLWPVNLAGVLALLLVFPDGRRRGWLWSALPWCYAVATLAIVTAEWGARLVDGQVVGGPRGVLPAVLGAVGLILVGLCLLAAFAQVVVRYRRGDGRRRAQMRWLLLAGGCVVLLLLGGWAAQAAGIAVGAVFLPFIVAIVVLVPVAVGIAVVRHDLYDVDRLLGDSAAWALTLILSAALFGAVVLLASRALGAGTGIGPTAAAFATALVLLPLHRSVAAFVGRIVDRDRHVAVASVERFTADVRAGRREPEEVEDVLREAQGDPDLRLYLARPDGGWVLLDGRMAYPVDGFAVETGGDRVACITLGWDSRRARRRIADLARAAWVPIEVARLRRDLRESLAETRASRARLAAATAAERRRLERDLHDGAQQRLLATGMRLRTIQSGLDPHHAAEMDIAVAELEATVGELRRLAHGVRPTRLDDGLEAALAAVRADTPLPFELVFDEMPPLDDTRALTAYLIVSEAVTNVLKHARATRIDVRLGSLDGRLTIAVRDDGIGGLGSGEALTALRDRVLSVGGRFSVDSPPGGGTTIRAVL